MSQVCWCTK